MQTESTIRELIVGNLAWPGSPELLTADYSLIDSGVIDSLGVYQLVTSIEGHFGIQIDIAELVPQNFETIEAIAQLVNRKVG